MANKFLSELEFDTQYRLAKPEFYYDGIVYYHKVKYAEGYVAEEAGVHASQVLDKTQFEQDAFHQLAYLPAGEIPEQVLDGERQATIDGIMKEGQIVETFNADEPESKPKKAAKQEAKKATAVKKVEKTAEIQSQELTEEKQQQAAGESIISPLAEKHD